MFNVGEVFSIENKIIANVEKEIISSYELKNKIKTNLFLSNNIVNQENINRSKKQAMKTLINYKLKKQEVLKYNITTNDQAVDDHLKSMHLKFNTDHKGYENIFKQNDLNYELYLNEIITEYQWQKLIFSLYGNQINLEDREIDGELNKIISKQKDIIEYKLAEIEVINDNKDEIKIKIDEILKQIKLEGFENTAIKYSSSTSAMNGGNLDWINSTALSNNILNILKKMNIGEISKPIFQTNTVTFLKVIKKRNINPDELDADVLKKNITIQKKNDLLNLFSNNHLSKLKNNSFIQIK
jgi:peptidyl-prolyl cis-trans isomerase SurA